MKEAVALSGNNYRVEGMRLLLQEDCILNRYHPLVPHREALVAQLLDHGCVTRDDCLTLTDAELVACGLPAELTGLFRRFLRLYDSKSKGLRVLPDASACSGEDQAALLELMRLPGIKAKRAQLYHYCGLRLADFAAADAELLRRRIAEIIARDGLPFAPPLPKELRTQIAVARVFTEYSAQ